MSRPTTRRRSLGAAPAGAGLTASRWNRAHHEQMAAEEMAAAQRHLTSSRDCSSTTVYALVNANRLVAHARTHLSAIGPSEGKRTVRLWRAVQKVEDRVNAANNRLAACLVKR